ncbi:MAG: hypothetical protein H6773_02695 [Pseudomonadales bacterium]|nr:hypothetical protein [Candidatus Woesebacteria bacterium]MCB9801064.1 hypothetical protein [Pseudomonadales bacterium]
MSYQKEALLARISDPRKIAYVQGLNDLELLDALTTPNYTLHHDELIEKHADAPILWALRVIFYQKLMDWGSERAEAIQKEIAGFKASDSFVRYPDFLLEEDIVLAMRTEHMNNNSLELRDLQGEYGPNIEIIGARVNDEGHAEVLILHNQMKPGSMQDGPMAFDKERLDIPPETKIGLLKMNPALPLYGRSNQVYISMQPPYPDSRNSWIEVVIGQMGEDGIIMPIENV